MNDFADPDALIEDWHRRAIDYEEHTHDRAKYGELFSTCGDLGIDNQVARVLLNPVQGRLPAVSSAGEDGAVTVSRKYDRYQRRAIPSIPQHLFTIDWGGFMSWYEAYYVTAVPRLNIKIVTASSDSTEIRGHTDLAIGWCRDVRTPDFGCKKILRHWWRRGCGVDSEMWAAVVESGLIDEARAEKWASGLFARYQDWA